MNLEIRDLSVRYGSGKRALTAVDRVTITVPSGGTVGLVGESGSGKSTVARAIVGLIPLAGGRVLVDGKDWTSRAARNRKDFRRRIQMIFQDPYSSLNPRMTVGEALAEAQRTSGTRSHKNTADRVRQLLDLVGVPQKAAERYPHQFSGGQLQRIAIARALAVSPELIIHDEVTSALDVSVQATILNLLRELQTSLGLTYLFISHDLSTVRYMSDVVAVMYLGQLVETAPTDRLFDYPQHPYTQGLIASIPRLGYKRAKVEVLAESPDPRRPPSGCRFRTRCPVGPLSDPDRHVCIEVDPQTIARWRVNQAACHFALESGPLEGVHAEPADRASDGGR